MDKAQVLKHVTRRANRPHESEGPGNKKGVEALIETGQDLG